MKVLMFGWEFPPHISGGLGTACYGLTKGMSTIEDLDLIFVVPKAHGDEDLAKGKLLNASAVPLKYTLIKKHKSYLKNMEMLEVQSTLVPYTSPEEFYKLTKNKTKGSKKYIQTLPDGTFPFSGAYGKDLFTEIKNYGLVASQLAEKNTFDVIHAHDWLTYPAGIAAKQASGKPLVIHVHATDFDRSGGKVNPAVFEIEKQGMHEADEIIAVSNLTRNTVINKYGIDAKKVTTVYNAVEPAEFTQTPKAKNSKVKTVTFLGRITMQKGPEYFIEAAYKVLKKMPDVRFVMAGSGDMMDSMVERASALGIMDKFHFTGFLKGNDVNKMFEYSDLYIMPSVSEPFGISPLEAMQLGVPVIISKQSGVSEILDHVIKIDYWDIDKMANAIYGILKYPALNHAISTKGQWEANHLKWEESAKQVHQLYQKCVNS